ncbi:MAG: tRNA glutamyl-Q(34) synthetase GluQRS [Myxococcota bacterium]
MAERRFRFAPSPSRLLHVGNGLAALIGWAAARVHGGTFVLRIEDIDSTRCKPEFEAACLEDLRWLGLTWHEGPDVGGAYGPYRQSERLDRYDTLLEGLSGSNAYLCRCSRAEVRAAQRAPHLDQSRELPYPGTCRQAEHEPSAERLERGGFRLSVEAMGTAAMCHWTDNWMGPQSEDVRETCGDFLLGRPGAPTYQLAVVADDAAMAITDVVRGRDLLGSTARQRLLYRQLGAEAPQFAHHPLLLDAHGAKLSKRDSALTLRELRERGHTPDELISRLAYSIGLSPSQAAPTSAEEFADLMTDAPCWRDGAWSGLP